MNQQPVCRSVTGGIEIRVLVLPRSSHAEIVGVHNGALKIKVTSAPVDGEANDACRRLVAKLFGVPQAAVTIVRGSTSRQKVLRLEGIDEVTARKIIPSA